MGGEAQHVYTRLIRPRAKHRRTKASRWRRVFSCRRRGARARYDTDVAGLARRLAAGFDVRRPVETLARLGLDLRLYGHELRLPGRRVRGTWDPLLRRIELYECVAPVGDSELVAVLGHELWHALASRSHHPHAADDESAQRFAAAWLAALGPSSVLACASALRAAAVAMPAGRPSAGAVLSIGP